MNVFCANIGMSFFFKIINANGTRSSNWSKNHSLWTHYRIQLEEQTIMVRGYLLPRVHLPSSSKHKRCSTQETSASRQRLLVSIFGWIVRTTWARKRPKSFGFGAATPHLQLQHIIFSGHRSASSATVWLYQMKTYMKPMTSDTWKRGVKCLYNTRKIFLQSTSKSILACLPLVVWINVIANEVTPQWSHGYNSRLTER